MRHLLALTVVLAANHLHAAPEKWEADIARFEQADRTHRPAGGGILFIGSSSIRGWDTELFFPGMGVVNRGFGGSQIEDSIHFFDRIVTAHKPRTIVLYAGDNDIAAGKSAEQVFADYQKFASLVRSKLPGARLLFIAIKPSGARWKFIEAQRQANDLIRRHAQADEAIEFIDIAAPMLGGDGRPRTDLFTDDQLHLNHAGYSLWSSLVRPRLASARQNVWITNAYGDDVHIYEVGTWKLVKHLATGPQPHGIAASADGRSVFIVNENFGGAAGDLAWIDPVSFKVTHRIPVGPLPNEIECTPDGRWVYVPCADESWWVIDALNRRVVKRIPTGGRPHNTVVSSDGQRMYLSPMGAPRKVTIVDVAAGHQVIGEIPFDSSTRPPAISADERLFFQNIDNHLGFQVADIATRRVIKTIAHEYPSDVTKPSRCHGLAVRPDQQEIWCCDVERQVLHIHEAASGEYRQMHALDMPGRIYWVAFTPDSRYGFVSLRSMGKVAVIDCETKQIVTLLDAGKEPKRTQVIPVPE